MPFSDNDSAEPNVRAQLFELINKLSDDQLLIILKKIEDLPFKANRKHLRKRYPANIDFAVQEHEVKGVIHDISYSGLFIETGLVFSIGSDVVLEFSIHDVQDPIKISGEIVRKSPQGIGIEFKGLSKAQADIIKVLVDSR